MKLLPANCASICVFMPDSNPPARLTAMRPRPIFDSGKVSNPSWRNNIGVSAVSMLRVEMNDCGLAGSGFVLPFRLVPRALASSVSWLIRARPSGPPCASNLRSTRAGDKAIARLAKASLNRPGAMRLRSSDNSCKREASSRTDRLVLSLPIAPLAMTAAPPRLAMDKRSSLISGPDLVSFNPICPASTTPSPKRARRMALASNATDTSILLAAAMGPVRSGKPSRSRAEDLRSAKKRAGLVAKASLSAKVPSKLDRSTLIERLRPAKPLGDNSISPANSSERIGRLRMRLIQSGAAGLSQSENRLRSPARKLILPNKRRARPVSKRP